MQIDPGLSTTISIDAKQSQDEARIAVLTNSFYPCVRPSLCEPDIVQNAFVTIKNENKIGVVVDYMNDQEIYITTSNPEPDVGESVTLQVIVDNDTYTAISTMPDKSDKILFTRYNVDEPNIGLLLQLDTAQLTNTHRHLCPNFRWRRCTSIWLCFNQRFNRLSVAS